MHGVGATERANFRVRGVPTGGLLLGFPYRYQNFVLESIVLAVFLCGLINVAKNEVFYLSFSESQLCGVRGVATMRD